jgi:hypothetical protein
MEIALALVVVGIGMTAVVGIFPIALNTAADNNQQSRMALLGEEIAHGLRTKVLEEGTLDWDDEATPNFGGQLKLDLVMADLPSAKIWTPVTDSIEILIDGTDEPFIRGYHDFVYLAHASGHAGGIDNHNIGYRVVIEKPGSHPGGAARAFTWTTVREVRIELFERPRRPPPPGKPPPRPDLVYYTEIHKPVEVR